MVLFDFIVLLVFIYIIVFEFFFLCVNCILIAYYIDLWCHCDVAGVGCSRLQWCVLLLMDVLAGSGVLYLAQKGIELLM